jgi:hypothetical protein
VEHLKESREQVEYMRIHNEYRFIKKRALVNYLHNSRLNLEKHFHERAVAMLGSVKRFEKENLTTQMQEVARSAFQETLDTLKSDPEGTQRSSFLAALEGIKRGSMDYSQDAVMPILREKIAAKTAGLKGLTPEAESKLLSLTDSQKKVIANNDKSAKNGYLTAVPSVHSPSLKSHDKFRGFVDLLSQMKH